MSLDDTLAAINAVTSSCAQCAHPRGNSPSADFCSEACQRRWMSALGVDLPDPASDEFEVHLEITVDLSRFNEACGRVQDALRRMQHARLPSLPPQEFRRLYPGGPS